jgi:hypothetical protein
MSSNNNFLNTVSKTASYFGLGESRLRAFADGFVRGSLWFVLWSLILAAPLFFLLYLIAPEPQSSVDDFARSVVASVLQTAGGTSSFSAAGGVLENAKFFLDVAARPTALTFILAFFAYKRGRIRQSSEISDKGSDSTSLQYGIGLGAGFATLASAATFFVSGVVASTGFISIEPTSLLSWVIVVAVLAIPAWLGGLRASGSKRASSPWLWFYSSLRTFTLTYAALIVVALIVVWLYFLITPVFAMSTPTPETTGSTPLTGEQTRAILGGIITVLLVLPTLLYFGLSFGLGANVGLQTDFQGINILDVLGSILPTQSLSGLGNSNIESAYGVGPYAATIVLIALVALVSGAAAAIKTQSVINFKKHFLITLFATIGSAFVTTYLTSLSISWTNRGKETAELTDGALALQSGLISLGVTASSLLLICGLIAVFATLGGSTAKIFTSDAFPQLLRGLTFGRAVRSEQRDLNAAAFGALVTIAVVAAVAVPVLGASYVRAWAAADGPANKFNAIADELQKGDLVQLKERFLNKDTEYLAWFPDNVLQSALPTSAMGKSISVKNFSNEEWKVGDLDASGTVSWKLPTEELIKLKLVADGEIKNPDALFKHPEFTVRDTSVLVSVSAGEFMTPTGKANLTVNGAKTVPGQYNALPGAYVVTTDAYKLVAATKKTFTTTAAVNKFVADEKPSLKNEYEAILDKEINRLAKECSNFSAIEKSSCFTLGQIYNNRTDSDKKAPSEFFGFQTDSFKVAKFSCDGEPEDKLLSALHVKRARTCEVQMTFTLDYFKSKSEVRKLTRQETYNGCPEFGDAVCARSRTISLGSETVEVRGDKIGSAQFTSTVPFTVSAMGYLDAKDKFAIVKQFVKPTYEPIKKVVVKPVPVKKEFVLLGYYINLDELKYVVKSPKVGDAYAVTPERTIYVWSGKQWLELEKAK